MADPQKEQGVALVELAMVAAIAFIITSMAVPAFLSARRNFRAGKDAHGEKKGLGNQKGIRAEGVGNIVSNAGKLSKESGVSLIELVVAVCIIMILTAVAAPTIRTSLKYYHLMNAVASVRGAISSTRFQAIVNGCQYTIAFSNTTTTYQVQNQALTGNPPACAGVFTPVPPGNPISWSGSHDVSITTSTTLQFFPNGTVAPTTGNTNIIQLTNGVSPAETLTVSGVGNVSVIP